MEDKFKTLMYIQMLRGYTEDIKDVALLCIAAVAIGTVIQIAGLFLLWQAMM